MIFCGDENLKNALLQMQMFDRHSNLIKTDNYFRTHCFLRINLK